MTKHPATFPEVVLKQIDAYLGDAKTVLDPFAGTGGIHALHPARETFGVEIEPEWAGDHPRTLCADASNLPFADDQFDAIATSPAYGNRMADAYDGRDGSRRMTYRLALGHPLTEGNGAALQWGDEYRTLHKKVWRECVRVLRPGGKFILNIKDHVRKGQLQQVSTWHMLTLRSLGLRLVDETKIMVRGNAHVTDPNLRNLPERVVLMEKPHAKPIRYEQE